MDAIRDQDGNYYHEDCAPSDDADTLEFVSIEGMTCQECGNLIETKDETDEPAVEVDED